MTAESGIAVVAKTGFSHRLTPYKLVDISLNGHIYDFPSNNQVENRFCTISNISVTLLSSQVAQSLKSYWHFSDLGIALSHRHVEFFGLEGDDTARCGNEPDHSLQHMTVSPSHSHKS